MADFDSLTFDRQETVVLARRVSGGSASASDALEHALRATSIVLDVEARSSAGGSLTLTAEESDDGDSWSEIEEIGTLTRAGSASLTVTPTKEWLRVAWTGGGGWTLDITATGHATITGSSLPDEWTLSPDGALGITPSAAETDAALTVDAATAPSGNAYALVVRGRTTLDRSSVTGSPLVVLRDGSAVMTVDADGKTRISPTANDTNTQPAFDVNAATAISPLFRLRTNSADVLTIDKAGVTNFSAPGVGTWLSRSSSGVQIAALDSGSDIELCDASFNIVVQTTDDGRLGFYNHAATAQQTGVAVNAGAIHAALVNLGLITA